MLKTTLETLEGVDDALKPYYAETDGKFILQIEGVDEHPEVASLRNAYTRTKEDRERAKADAASLKAKIAELEQGAPDTAATQAKLAALEEKLAEAEARATDAMAKYTGVTRDQSLQSALTQSGITEPAFVKAATALLSSNVKLGDDGTAYVESSNGMGPKVLGDYVKQWAAGEGSAFVSKPQGAGLKGNFNGGNPTAPKGDLAGDKDARRAALKARFPDLP